MKEKSNIFFYSFQKYQVIPVTSTLIFLPPAQLCHKKIHRIGTTRLIRVIKLKISHGILIEGTFVKEPVHKNREHFENNSFPVTCERSLNKLQPMAGKLTSVWRFRVRDGLGREAQNKRAGWGANYTKVGNSPIWCALLAVLVSASFSAPNSE